jgi:DNA-binding transcriptional LysR family regulator
LTDGASVIGRDDAGSGEMNLANLDLNLLVPLDALLRERSVTRAAASLGLSQPSLSSSLARLRRHFRDELLVRVGNSYELTPLAVQLRRRTEVALISVERAFAAEPTFDPATSQREYRIVASDYPMAVLGGQVGRMMAERAPGMRLRYERLTGDVVAGAPDTLRNIDALVLPHGFITGVPHLDLFSDTWMCLVSSDNSRVGDVLTIEDLNELPWVLTFHSATAFTTAAHQLRMLGVQMRVQVVVESFLVLPFLVAGTDRIGLVQAHLVPRLAADVRALPCPYDVVPLIEAMWWHPVYSADPEHAWLRAVFVEAGKALDTAAAGAAVAHSG